MEFSYNDSYQAAILMGDVVDLQCFGMMSKNEAGPSYKLGHSDDQDEDVYDSE